jgi:hypothetical protein
MLNRFLHSVHISSRNPKGKEKQENTLKEMPFSKCFADDVWLTKIFALGISLVLFCFKLRR